MSRGTVWWYGVYVQLPAWCGDLAGDHRLAKEASLACCKTNVLSFAKLRRGRSSERWYILELWHGISRTLQCQSINQLVRRVSIGTVLTECWEILESCQCDITDELLKLSMRQLSSQDRERRKQRTRSKSSCCCPPMSPTPLAITTASDGQAT